MNEFRMFLRKIPLQLSVTGLLFLPFLANAQIKFHLPTAGFLNPTITSIEGLLLAILNIFIVIATPIIVLFIIYAGFLYVTAQGNAEQIKQATRAITYAVIGGVLIIGAVTLAGILKNVVESFRAP